MQTNHSSRVSLLLSLISFGAAFGCSKDTVLLDPNPQQPYSDGAVTVVGAAPDFPVVSGVVDGAACVYVGNTSSDCVPVVREGNYCKTQDGPVDVVVVDGKVAEVICYEDTDGASGPSVVVDVDKDGALDVPQQANGSVITFDVASDGVSIKGDRTVDGNDVTIYGNGPDKSIIDGNLRITGNNARVRGIRVTGNVVLELNTAALVFSVVEGNLVIESNNSLAAGNVVFGNLVVKGNNTILVGNDVQGNLENQGKNTTCSGNHEFEDKNHDEIFEISERGDPIACN